MPVKTKAPATQREIAKLRRDLAKKVVEADDLQEKLAAAEADLQEYKTELRPFLEELRDHRQALVKLANYAGQSVYIKSPFTVPDYDPIPGLEEGGDHE